MFSLFSFVFEISNYSIFRCFRRIIIHHINYSRESPLKNNVILAFHERVVTTTCHASPLYPILWFLLIKNSKPTAQTGQQSSAFESFQLFFKRHAIKPLFELLTADDFTSVFHTALLLLKQNVLYIHLSAAYNIVAKRDIQLKALEVYVY